MNAAHGEEQMAAPSSNPFQDADTLAQRMIWLRAQRDDPNPKPNVLLINNFHEFELTERAERALNAPPANAGALDELPTEEETSMLAWRIILAMSDLTDVEDRLTLEDEKKDSIAVAFIRAKKNIDVQIRAWKIMVCYGLLNIRQESNAHLRPRRPSKTPTWATCLSLPGFALHSSTRTWPVLTRSRLLSRSVHRAQETSERNTPKLI